MLCVERYVLCPRSITFTPIGCRNRTLVLAEPEIVSHCKGMNQKIRNFKADSVYHDGKSRLVCSFKLR